MKNSAGSDASIDFDMLLSSIPKGELDRIMDSIQAANMGVTIAEYRIDRALNGELHDEGESYRGLPPSLWPQLTFNWDFSRVGQRFALDGVTRQMFQSMYPDGLVLGRMPLESFDPHIVHFSRRDTIQELWSLGSASRLAKTIAYIHRGLPLTPPIAGPQDGGVILRGGNHRYAIAKAIQLETIPFLVAPDEVDAMSKLLNVNWGSP